MAVDGAACITTSMVRRHGQRLADDGARRRSAASWARSERFSTHQRALLERLADDARRTCARLSGLVTKS